MKRRSASTLLTSIVIVAMIVPAQPASAYLKFGVRVAGRQVVLKWSQTPVRYFVTDGGVPGVSASDFQAAVGRAFATWAAVPTASIRYEFAGLTSSLPLQDDGRSTLGFLSRPDLDRVLASTSFLIDDATGALVESDIFFNSAFPWSVAPAGETGKFDLESTALHEIGRPGLIRQSAREFRAEVCELRRARIVGASLRRTRRRFELPDAGQIRSAVGRSWRPGHRLVQPLGAQGQASPKTRDDGPDGTLKITTHGPH